MSHSDLATLPTPAHLTLLFKHHKSTALLSLLPTTTLDETKSLLLSVLRSRNITTLPGTSIPLPSKPTDLELGILLDRKDASKGWVSAEDWSTASQAVPKKKGSTKKEGAVETIGDLDLKDGSWIAYRVADSGDPIRVVDEGVGEDGMEVEVDVHAQNGAWNVVVPRFEDEEEGGGNEMNGGRRGFAAEDDEAADEDDDLEDVSIPEPRNSLAR